MAEARVKTIFFWTCTTFKNNYCIGVGHVWGRRNCGCAQDSRLCMCNIVQTSPCCSAGSCRRNETSPYEGTASASRHVTARHGTAVLQARHGSARHATDRSRTQHRRYWGQRRVETPWPPASAYSILLIYYTLFPMWYTCFYISKRVGSVVK